MIRFQEVWQKSKSTEGAFSPEEGKILFNKAMICGENSNIVEIGSYLGKSSSILGQVAKYRNQNLTCIDPFVDSCGDIKRGDMEQAFRANMERLNLDYELLVMKSKDAFEVYDKEIGLILFDGDHRGFVVEQDMELWLPRVKVGGYALFHDYGGTGWPGVKVAVDKINKKEFICEGIQQTIIVYKRIHG